MSEIQQQEASLMEAITSRLEEFEYLPRIRSELKVIALKKAKELGSSGKINVSNSSFPSKHLDENDLFTVALCKELFEYCRLDKTCEALSLEVENNLENVDAKMLNLQQGTPAILQIIEKQL